MTEHARPLRADAAKNAGIIRQAALDVFRASGFTAPLDEVARAAGVSKGTIYHRFGGRQGLIDTLVHDLVADKFASITQRVEELTDPGERFARFLRQVWLLQFDEPAANDVLLRISPESDTVISMCNRVRAFGERLLRDGQASAQVRSDLVPEDLYLLIWERGIVARACDRQSRTDYERRVDFVLNGLMTAMPAPS